VVQGIEASISLEKNKKNCYIGMAFSEILEAMSDKEAIPY